MKCTALASHHPQAMLNQWQTVIYTKTERQAREKRQNGNQRKVNRNRYTAKSKYNFRI